MKMKIHYWLGLLLCLFSTAVIAQQPVEEWAKRYDGKGGLTETAVAMAVDAAGNVYVTGTVINMSTTGSSHISTIKYSPAGDSLWSKAYLGKYSSQAADIAVDDAGGVYVTGRSFLNDNDYITIRYDAATGSLAWEKFYDSGFEDKASAIAVDNAGSVYVTGTSDDGFGATIRYNAITGARNWNSPFPGSATAITVDNAGGVYVTGYSYKETDYLYDLITVRYDVANGAESWSQSYDTNNTSINKASIAIDAAGNSYVTGTSRPGNTGIDRIVTIKYSSVGDQQWAKVYEKEYSSQAVSIAVDNAGGVYIAGSSVKEIIDTNTSLQSGFVTIRYESDTGLESWDIRYEGESKDPEVLTPGYATDIAVDYTGGIYVSGYSYGIHTESYDYATIHYDAATGIEKWSKRYDGGSNGQDIATAIAVDYAGNVYVTGSSDGGITGLDFATISYKAFTGEDRWVERYNLAGSNNDRAVALAIDAIGNSYVTGTSSSAGFSRIVTIKYSPTGDLLWAIAHNDKFATNALDIAVDDAGGVYVTGTSSRGVVSPTDYITSDIVTIRYEAVTGVQSWVEYYDGGQVYDDSPSAIAVDNAGGVYVTGNSMFGDDGSDSPREYITIRYEAATGAKQWDARYKGKTYNGINFSYNYATAITVDNTGGVYVTGTSTTSRGNDLADYVTIRYDAATGKENWVMPYNGKTNGYEEATSIAVDNQGGVYVTGRSDGDYATVRYDAATGEQRWAKRYDFGNDSYDFSKSIAVDNQGSVYVTGHSDGGSTNEDYATIRYDATTGKQMWVSRYNRGVNNSDFAIDIAVDKRGGVYVTGYSNGESGMVFSTVKYSSANGELLWDVAGPSDVAVGMALDNEDNVIVTGYTLHPDTGYDFITVKYSQTGCPAVAEAHIMGSLIVPVRINRSVYSLHVTNPTTFVWSITDSEGRVLSSFDGQGSNSITVNWPSVPNLYKLSVTYGEGESCPSYTATAYVHVFDPKAGFVTGGGWFQSPANPDYEFMQSSTKAHFGLSAKYKKGDDNLVQGETKLLLESGALYFRGTVQQDRTLVIFDNHAFYRGSGTVSYLNGMGQKVTDTRHFNFLVAATDGGQGKNKGPDKLRLIVWEMNEDGSLGKVVYDNQTGCGGSRDENALACQGINGGNIKIHHPGLAGKRDQQLQAVENTAGEHRLAAYPTAFQEKTTIAFSLEQKSAYTLDLYDLKGILVRRVAAGDAENTRRYEHEVQATGLTKGLYFVRLTTVQGVQTVKIVLQR